MVFLNNKAIGLDIDDRSLELVELKKIGNRAKLVSFSRQALPAGIIKNGLIANPELLTHYLELLFNNTKPGPLLPKKISLALPEGQSYDLVVTTPFYDEEMSEEAVRQLIIKNLPVNIDDLLFSYQIIQTEPKKAMVSIVAANKAAAGQWLDFFENLKIDVDLLDSEIFALARDLVYLDPKQPVCLVDIGSVQTNIAVLQGNAVYYSSSLNMGGHFFTKSIAEAFKLKIVTAERKKLQLGLNSQIFPVLTPDLKTMAGEIKSAVSYYQEHYGGAVKEVVLVGGSSRLRGLVSFLQENLGMPVGLGKIKSLADKLPLEYYGAIGLAWRSLNKKKFAEEPDFLALAGEHKSMAKRTAPIVLKAAASAKATMPAKLKNPAADEVETAVLEPLADDEEELTAGDNNEDAKKIANQKKLLLIVLLVGILLLPVAFWYRQQQRDANAAKVKLYASSSYNQVQSLTFTVPVILDKVAVADAQVKGHIVESTILAGKTPAEGLPDALVEARGKLVKGETIWSQPVNEIISQDKLTAPLVIRWLAYVQATAIKAALTSVDALNKDKVPYAFNNLEIVSVAKTDNANSLNMTLKISLSLGQLIAGAPVAPAPPVVENPTATSTASTTVAVATTTPPAGAKLVLIKKTETGWLNIRTGAGATFPILQKINDSGTYEWLAEQGEWTQIKLPDGRTGWGASRYMQKL